MKSYKLTQSMFDIINVFKVNRKNVLILLAYGAAAVVETLLLNMLIPI